MALASSRFAGGTAGASSTTLALGGKRFEFDKIPDIRAESEDGHGLPDERDMERVSWGTFLYDSQDDVLRRWMRQVEENAAAADADVPDDVFAELDAVFA